MTEQIMFFILGSATVTIIAAIAATVKVWLRMNKIEETSATFNHSLDQIWLNMDNHDRSIVIKSEELDRLVDQLNKKIDRRYDQLSDHMYKTMIEHEYNKLKGEDTAKMSKKRILTD